MGRYIVGRVLGMIPTLFIIITLSFFIIRLAPGGPFDQERQLPPVVKANIEAKYHLDEPLTTQYARYLWNILHGDLGPSYRYIDHDVNFYIGQSLPNSLLLGSISLAIAFVFGIGCGLISAIYQNKWPDYLCMGISIVSISIPLFVVGPLLMYLFSIKLGWLPTSGWITEKGPITLILPVVTLSLSYFASIARLSRASFLEVLRSDYIRTARAKGLPFHTIIFRHAFKGALLPVVSYLGPAFAGIITGSVVVEQIFRVPGIGHIFIQASLNRDYTLIMGIVIVYSVILIFMNLLVDILYSFLDPQIAY